MPPPPPPLETPQFVELRAGPQPGNLLDSDWVDVNTETVTLYYYSYSWHVNITESGGMYTIHWQGTTNGSSAYNTWPYWVQIATIQGQPWWLKVSLT